MSRSGYSDDCEYAQLWEAAVDRATFGKRGQAFMRKLRDALDAMPVKRLITDAIQDETGAVCALGAVDPNAKGYDAEDFAIHFGIARALAAEIVYRNDEDFGGRYGYVEGPSKEPPYPSYGGQVEHRGIWTWIPYTPEERWQRMRDWVEKQIGPDDSAPALGDK